MEHDKPQQKQNQSPQAQDKPNHFFALWPWIIIAPLAAFPLAVYRTIADKKRLKRERKETP